MMVRVPNTMTINCIIGSTKIAVDQSREKGLQEIYVKVESTRITSNEENVEPLTPLKGIFKESRLMKGVSPHPHYFL